jgi:hypothetical protein
MKPKTGLAIFAAIAAVGMMELLLPDRASLIGNIVLPVPMGVALLCIHFCFRNRKFGFLKPFLISLCVIAPVVVGGKSTVYCFSGGPIFVFMAVDFIIGFIVACVAAVKFGLMEDREKEIVICILIGTFVYVSILTDAYAKHFNYLLDSGETTAYTVDVIDKEKDVRHRRHGGSNTTYSLKIRVEGKVYRIIVNESAYNSYEVGDPYSLERYQGAFGRPFVIPK